MKKVLMSRRKSAKKCYIANPTRDSATLVSQKTLKKRHGQKATCPAQTRQADWISQ
jgi:hypothetical protein